jgi:hypothetical protein
VIAAGEGAGGGDAENWIEAPRYLKMEYLKEHKKAMRRAV